MTTELSRTAAAVPRLSTARRLLMCPPTYFEVSYSINPWMQPHVPVDLERAQSQWPRCGSRTSGWGTRCR